MVVTAVFAFVLLATALAARQDYFSGFEVATQADVVHITGQILARPDDDACAFDAEILVVEAESALHRHGFNAVVLQTPVVIDGVAPDVSALIATRSSLWSARACCSPRSTSIC